MRPLLFAALGERHFCGGVWRHYRGSTLGMCSRFSTAMNGGASAREAMATAQAVAFDVDSTVTEGDNLSTIVVQATSAGLTPATISIPVTTDATAGVLEVAATSAGKPVVFD